MNPATVPFICKNCGKKAFKLKKPQNPHVRTGRRKSYLTSRRVTCSRQCSRDYTALRANKKYQKKGLAFTGVGS